MIVGNLTGAMVYILTLLQVLFWPYLFSHLADSSVDRITSIQRSVYNLNWYDFSPGLQKYFILILAQSQRDISFDGFSLVFCTLESFGMVVVTLLSDS